MQRRLRQRLAWHSGRTTNVSRELCAEFSRFWILRVIHVSSAALTAKLNQPSPYTNRYIAAAYSPMSSFHSSGRVAMNVSISWMQVESLRTINSTPRLRR